MFTEYYPDPLAFNPERFNPEFGGIKEFRDRCVLIPFGDFHFYKRNIFFDKNEKSFSGDGPRICLGMKFGALMVKTMIAETLKNFEISVDEKTPKNLKISAVEFLNVPDAAIMLNFKPI